MKLPFEFGIKLIFRLVIPGFILSLGFLPALSIVLKMNGWADKAEYAFVVLLILLGWLITMSDMFIYMVLEGRRYWPEWLKRFCIDSEKKRLAKLIRKTHSEDERTRREAYFDLRNIVMKENGEYEIVLPSRLGNLIYAFEGYSKRMYGAEAVFYWSRIWLKIDKDTREEVDNMQALVDSTAYTCFVCLLSGVLWLLYAVVKGAIVIVLHEAELLGPRLANDLTLIDQLLPRKGVSLFLAIIFIAAGLVIYRASLRVHAQFGELFKSIIDVNIGELNVAPIINDLSSWAAQSPVDSLNRDLSRREQFNLAWRYMQFFRYRCPACSTLLKPNEIATHFCLEFKIHTEPAGSWRWQLERTDGQPVLVDHNVAYESEENCRNVIKLIQNSWDAPVIEEIKEPPPHDSDLSSAIAIHEKAVPITYVYYREPSCKWRWRVIGSSHCTIADSAADYESAPDCKKDIERVKNSKAAPIVVKSDK